MYYDFRMRIPFGKGKVYRISKKDRDAVYVVLEYGSNYLKDRGYCIGKRVTIGKACDGDGDMMFPNGNYYRFFPDEAMPTDVATTERSCSLRIGAYAVIRRIAEGYGLPSQLGFAFPDDTGLLLDLAAFSIVTEDNAGQYYPDFAYCHPLFSPGMRIYSDSSVSRFLRSVTADQTVAFLNGWNEGKDHRHRVYVSYDPTDKNSNAGEIDFAESGHPKVDTGYPVTGLSMAYDGTDRVPLFYEEYPLSISDVSQFQHMVGKAQGFGYRNIGFILDRGCFSKENITLMDKCGYAFVIMAKGCRSLVSSLVLSVRGTFESDRKRAIKAYRAYGVTVMAKLYASDATERYFHIYYNPGLEASERDALERKLSDCAKVIKRYEGQAVEFGPGITGLFEILRDKEGKVLFGRERTDVISRELSLCGYFAIVTSERMGAEDALVIYKSRDSSEKLFSADKSFLGGKSLRVRSNESASAKLFVSFVALIIRNRMYCLLKDEMLKRDRKSNFMTVPKAIRELEKIEMVRLGDGTYRLDHAVTATQKAILSAFGMDEKDIGETAKEVSALLKSGGDLLDTTDEGKGDKGYCEDEDDFLC